MTDKTSSGGDDGGEENRLIAERRAKLAELRSAGGAFPNDFRRDALAGQLHDAYGEKSAEWLEANPTRVKVGGRMMFKRLMGKASFVKIADRTGQVQLFLQAQALGASYEAFKGWDVGDIIGAGGVLFRTKTGEAYRVRAYDGAAAAGEVAKAAAGQVARAGRHRDALPPPLRGPDRQRAQPQGLPRAHADHRLPARLPRRGWTSSRSRRR